MPEWRNLIEGASGMIIDAARREIERGTELGWRLRDVAPGHLGWVLFAKESPNDPWLGLLAPEIRQQTQEGMRSCPYRVSIMEFHEEMYEDGSYATDPWDWRRDETHRFRTFEEALSWLGASGYPAEQIGDRATIGAP